MVYQRKQKFTGYGYFRMLFKENLIGKQFGFAKKWMNVAKNTVLRGDKYAKWRI